MNCQWLTQELCVNPCAELYTDKPTEEQCEECKHYFDDDVVNEREEYEDDGLF